MNEIVRNGYIQFIWILHSTSSCRTNTKKKKNTRTHQFFFSSGFSKSPRAVCGGRPLGLGHRFYTFVGADMHTKPLYRIEPPARKTIFSWRLFSLVVSVSSSWIVVDLVCGLHRLSLSDHRIYHFILPRRRTNTARSTHNSNSPRTFHKYTSSL